MLFQLHIESSSESQPEETKPADVDFFRDHTSNVKSGYGDSPTGTPPRVESPARLVQKSSAPPRVGSGGALSSLSRENGSSSPSLTVNTDSGKCLQAALCLVPHAIDDCLLFSYL